MSTDIQPRDDGETSLQAMLEETRNVQRRVTTVEETVTQHDRRLMHIEVTLPDLKRIVDSVSISVEKLTDLQGMQGQKTVINEAAIVAMEKRTDTIAEHMQTATNRLADNVERLADKQEEARDKVSKLETKMGLMQALGLSAGSVIVAIVIQHAFILLGGK